MELLKDTRKDFGTLKDASIHVAEGTGCSASAVKRAYHRSRAGLGDAHGRRKLTPSQETALVAVVQAFSVNNMALSVAQMREMIKRKWGVQVSRTWVNRFVGRHRRQLSKRACKALADKRVGKVVFDGVVLFCEELENFLQHYSFPAHAVFNFDETRIVQKGGNMKLCRVEAAGKERANVRSTRHNTVASLLTFVSADGGVMLSVDILNGRFKEANEATVNFTMEEAPSTTRGTWPRFFCWTDTGYLDADTFKAVLSKVAEVWHVRNPGIPALLFGDQLAAHRRADIAEFALTLGLFLFSLAANTSHITQPLDEAPFGVLQLVTRHNHEVAVMDGMLTNSNTRDALLMAAYAAERRAFTRPVISGAFRRRGLWPFDPKLMQANVRANLGMVETGETPEEAARSAAAAVIQAAQERVAYARGRVNSGRAVVQRGVVHSPFMLLEKHRQALAEEAQERQDKADRALRVRPRRRGRSASVRTRRRQESYAAAGCVRSRSTAGARHGPVADATFFGCAPHVPSLSRRGSRWRSISRTALGLLRRPTAAAVRRAWEAWGAVAPRAPSSRL